MTTGIKILDKFIDAVDIPQMTIDWLTSWAATAKENKWSNQQLYYLTDTALLHATVWGDLDTTGLSELHKREQFMGLDFGAQHETQSRAKPKVTKLEVIQGKRQKKANKAM